MHICTQQSNVQQIVSISVSLIPWTKSGRSGVCHPSHQLLRLLQKMRDAAGLSCSYFHGMTHLLFLGTAAPTAGTHAQRAARVLGPHHHFTPTPRTWKTRLRSAPSASAVSSANPLKNPPASDGHRTPGFVRVPPPRPAAPRSGGRGFLAVQLARTRRGRLSFLQPQDYTHPNRPRQGAGSSSPPPGSRETAPALPHPLPQRAQGSGRGAAHAPSPRPPPARGALGERVGRRPP